MMKKGTTKKERMKALVEHMRLKGWKGMTEKEIYVWGQKEYGITGATCQNYLEELTRDGHIRKIGSHQYHAIDFANETTWEDLQSSGYNNPILDATRFRERPKEPYTHNYYKGEQQKRKPKHTVDELIVMLRKEIDRQHAGLREAVQQFLDGRSSLAMLRIALEECE